MAAASRSPSTTRHHRRPGAASIRRRRCPPLPRPQPTAAHQHDAPLRADLTFPPLRCGLPSPPVRPSIPSGAGLQNHEQFSFGVHGTYSHLHLTT